MKRFILFVFILFAFLATLPKLFEKKIVTQAIAELNKAIAVPVIIDDINFTFLRRFPHATIHLKNVKILSGKNFNSSHFNKTQNADTLARINNVYLAINTLSLFNKTLEIKKIEINDAYVNILIDGKGKNNYNIFKENPTKEKSDSNQFDIKLNKVLFIKTHVAFNNLYKQTIFEVSAPNLSAKGAFFKDNYTVSTRGDLLLKRVQLGTSVYKPEKPSKLDLSMSFSNDTLNINKSIIKTQYADFDVSGYTIFKKLNYTNIDIKGKSVSIKHIIQILPFKEQLKDFETNGYLDFNGLIKGNISNTVSPYLLANFGISNGSIKYKDSLEINNINLKGRFSNGKQRNAKSMNLTFKSFHFKTNNSDFDGSLSIDNFIEPAFKIKSNLNLDLSEFNPLFSNDHVNGFSGRIKGEIETQGKSNNNTRLDSLLFLMDQTTAKLTLSDFHLNLTKQNIHLKEYNGKLFFQPDKIQIDSLSGKFNGINTNISWVTIQNLNDIFNTSSTKVLNIDGDFAFDTLNILELKTLFKSDKQSKPLPFTIKGQLGINQYTHNKIIAKNLSSNFMISNGKYQINNLSFQAFNGNISSSINYQEKSKSRAILQTKTQTNNIDISAYLDAFNNFGQNNLTAEHIKGDLTSNFESEITLINNKIDMNSIYLLGYAKITNGQLINYEPIEELARFTKLDELSNISFSTIENELLISDHTIHIPQMDIHSTSFDISLFGKQDLLGDYEYHLKVYLSDILSGKSKQIQKQQSTYGSIQDDGLGRTSIFLVTSHKDGKTKTRFDKKQLREHLNTEISQEKAELKQIFNDEFNWFANDTSIDIKKVNKAPAFEIEWDDD